MPKRMLIDASHPEETRVVVLDGNKVEEFDFESAAKLPLKGNIYLAKVTRVEPSLQAAFVEYGGNRQGFLAFSEIHPDYYQIPMADRQALLTEAQAEARKRSEDDIESFDIGKGKQPAADESSEEPETASDESDEEAADTTSFVDDEDEAEAPTEETPDGEAETGEIPAEIPPHDGDSGAEFGFGEPAKTADAAPVASDGPSEAADAAPDQTDDGKTTAVQPLQAKRPSQRWMHKRHYKIQEVIKRRQIILVQVVKEERGNKGAALTTYLSLAGRYCVLMPNTPRGGGISRKITNATDRKRLKAAAQSLELPEGMGLIIRTAGGNRTKLEIKRDYEYLLRMWDTVRETTLNSTAPACVYEEGDLVKRAIRDLYNKDVAEVLVEGDDGYRSAKDFMRMLMPSHAKNVKPYKETVPLFQRFHIEAQLDSMFSPTVTLKSGGYIVINQTEALVAIDVNSGRATKEHSIEETALKTNLEAADEVGRQMRLRDLAGLVVIDYIDMEDSRNDRLVEKRTAAAVKNDRARIQIGRISQFGLLELSRQRLRAGVVASSSVLCPHCGGTGLVRSVESTSLRVLRGIEEEAQKQRAENLKIKVASEVALYMLNHKRAELAQMESDNGIAIAFEPKEGLKAGDFEIDRIGQREPPPKTTQPVTVDTVAAEPEELVEAEETETETAPVEGPVEEAQPQQGESRRRHRRRGGRGRDRGGERDPNQQSAPMPQQAEAAVVDDATAETGEPATELQGGEGQPQNGERKRRRRRRGRRGGRNRNGNPAETPQNPVEPIEAAPAVPAIPAIPSAPVLDVYEDRFGRIEEIDTTPREAPRLAPAAAVAPVSLTEPEPPVAPSRTSEPEWSFTPAPTPKAEPPKPEPKAAEPVKAPAPEPKPAEPVAPVAPVAAAPEKPAGPPHKGWWQRTFKG
jgi:ribonuclease E